MIRFLCLGLLAVFSAGPVFADPAEFAAHCAKLGLQTQEAGEPSTPGADASWYFLTKELLHTGTGQFWTKNWAEIAVNRQDPVPFIVHLNSLLQAKKIELLLVPIPAKTTIYPDKVAETFGPDDAYPTAPFFERLKSAGVAVLDLEPTFRAERAAGNQMHCQRDSHYTPHACQVISGLIAERLKTADWLKNQPKSEIVRGPASDLVIVGDQVPEERRSDLHEVLKVRFCGKSEGGKLVPIQPVDDSPVLLLGDSHTLVFQEGASSGMHSNGAGLLDNLQADLGFAIDRVGVRGSGLRAARAQLYRNVAGAPSYWDAKKLVIWAFSVREFTQSFDKLMNIPIERPG